MSHDGSMCAHLNVKYDPIDNSDRTKSDRWTCTLCGHDFWPKQWLFPAPWQRAASNPNTVVTEQRITAAQPPPRDWTQVAHEIAKEFCGGSDAVEELIIAKLLCQERGRR